MTLITLPVFIICNIASLTIGCLIGFVISCCIIISGAKSSKYKQDDRDLT